MSQPEGQRLDSWKEIAEYLARDLSTVRRWEREKGLPVHRVPGGSRRAVFAYSTQIDAWLAGLEDGDQANTYSECEAELHRGASADLSGNSRAQKVHVSSTPLHEAASNRSWVRKHWAWPAFGCVVLTVAVWLLQVAHGGPVAELAFGVSSLVARNGRGVILWIYDFGRPLARDTENPIQQRVAIANMGGDRRGDVFVAVPFYSEHPPNSWSDTLYCLSAHGKLRWRYEFDDKPRFGTSNFRPRWIAAPLMVTTDEARSRIWCAARDAFASTAVLVALDRDSHVIGQFVNFGHIAALSVVHNASGSYVLVGGISNQCDCAMLAVLREDDPSGSSPLLPGSTSVCENCPPGAAYRYILFPRSELTHLSGAAYNNLKTIQVDGGRVWVGVTETSSAESPGPDWERYDLSESFIPQSVSISDHYWILHRQMEERGLVHHSVAQCPERSSVKTIQMWSPEHGWQEIAVPMKAQH